MLFRHIKKKSFPLGEIMKENIPKIDNLYKNFKIVKKKKYKKIINKIGEISELKNNLKIMEIKSKEIAKQRDKWKNEADLFKTSEFNTINELSKIMENNNEYDLQIREYKDQIFNFLINERNKGTDKIRVDFYKSIINLLMFASDTENESKFNLKALVNYFTIEGK